MDDTMNLLLQRESAWIRDKLARMEERLEAAEAAVLELQYQRVRNSPSDAAAERVAALEARAVNTAVAALGRRPMKS